MLPRFLGNPEDAHRAHDARQKRSVREKLDDQLIKRLEREPQDDRGIQ